MSQWLNTEVTWDVHMANMRLDMRFFASITKTLQQSETPQVLERFFRAVLTVAEGGRYRDAQLYRLFAPREDACWYITLIHPALPAVPVDALLPTLALEISQTGLSLIEDSLDRMRSLTSQAQFDAIVAEITAQLEGRNA